MPDGEVEASVETGIADGVVVPFEEAQEWLEGWRRAVADGTVAVTDGDVQKSAAYTELIREVYGSDVPPVKRSRKRDRSADEPAAPSPQADVRKVASKDEAGEKREAVPAIVVEEKKEQKLTSTSLWEMATGWTKWRVQRQVNRSVAEARAQYVGIDSWGEEDIDVAPKVGFVEHVRQKVDEAIGAKLAARPRNSIHREHYRFQRNARIVKALTEEVYCNAKGRFQKADPNDMRCLHLVVKQVVEGAVKDGIMVALGPGGEEQKVVLKRCQRKFFTEACEAAYFVRDESEQFWTTLATEGKATSK